MIIFLLLKVKQSYVLSEIAVNRMFQNPFSYVFLWLHLFRYTDWFELNNLSLGECFVFPSHHDDKIHTCRVQMCTPKQEIPEADLFPECIWCVQALVFSCVFDPTLSIIKILKKAKHFNERFNVYLQASESFINRTIRNSSTKVGKSTTDTIIFAFVLIMK